MKYLFLSLLVSSCYGNTVQLRGRIRQNYQDQDGGHRAVGQQYAEGADSEKKKKHECEIGAADKCRIDGKTCQYNEHGVRKCLPPYC